MKSTTQVDLAVVGCGRLTELGYLDAVAISPHARIVAVVDPAELRRNAVVSAAPGRVAAAGTLEEILHDPGVHLDGVIIASPAETHLAAAALAAEAGLAVLVEKPPAPDAGGAAEIAAITPTPWVGFNRRFDPGAMKVWSTAREWSSRPGHLDVSVDLCYRHRSWSPYAVHDDVLADLGPHAFDWVRWVSGAEATAVTATAEHHHAQVKVDLDTGGTATIRLASNRLHRERLAVTDSAGAVAGDHRLGGPVAAVTGRLRRGPHPLVTTLSAQVSAFALAIGGQASSQLGTAADGVAVMAAIDAARRSAATGTPATVDHLDSSPS